MKDEYTKDPNKVRPDHEISEDRKYIFTYKDGTLKCDKLNLQCAAQGRQIAEVILPGGFTIKSDTDSSSFFTVTYFLNEKELDCLKEHGVFDEVDIFGCK